MCSPTSGWVFMTVHSSSVSGPGLLRIDSGTRTLPMSWRTAPSSTLRTASRSRSSSAATATASRTTSSVCWLVTASFASSALESEASVSRQSRCARVVGEVVTEPARDLAVGARVVGDLPQEPVLELRDEARLAVQHQCQLAAGNTQHPLLDLLRGDRPRERDEARERLERRRQRDGPSEAGEIALRLSAHLRLRGLSCGYL